ncbi:MAG: 5-deoxyadenosylcobinamide phosphate nucleotidyltransferase [Nitrosopumilus sp. H8]|nr:MAG: 5-deoxyadenosylcobinamide phosphate nucleotidyltransferase [Nitrosopumilus sp. H13]RNJ80159.1 MAG: 5-deoxyadenosylcobinamide phosphate nucleotidyltransferase [Nitrosopumilus sp. H8]
MIGMVMAGGRGTRMGSKDEKLMLLYAKPVVMRVVDSLRDSGCIEEVLAVTSPNSPRTKRLLQDSGVRTVDSSGAGYVEDLYYALRQVEGAVLAVSGDMPLLDGEMVRKIASHYDGYAWTGMVATLGFLRSQQIEPGPPAGGGCCHTGASLVNSSKVSSPGMVEERHVVIDDRRVAFNLNTRRDYELLCAL